MQPHEFGVNKRDVILLRMRAYHLLEVTKGCVQGDRSIYSKKYSPTNQ